MPALIFAGPEKNGLRICPITGDYRELRGEGAGGSRAFESKLGSESDYTLRYLAELSPGRACR